MSGEVALRPDPPGARGSLVRIYAALTALVLGLGAGDAIPAVAVVVAGGAAMVCLGTRRRPVASLAGLLVAAAACGALVASPRSERVALEELAPSVPNCDVQGRLLEHAGGLGSLVAADVVDCEGHAPQTRAGVVVVDRPEADAGARLILTGWLLPLSEEDSFDVARMRLGAHASMSTSELRVVAPPSGLHGLAGRIRTGLGAAVSGMDTQRAALLTGLTTGDTGGMGAVTEDQLRRAGLSHLVAVSGYIGAYTDGFRDTLVLGAQVGFPGRALPTSVQGRPGLSRRRLVITGTFDVPRSAWARR